MSVDVAGFPQNVPLAKESQAQVLCGFDYHYIRDCLRDLRQKYRQYEDLWSYLESPSSITTAKSHLSFEQSPSRQGGTIQDSLRKHCGMIRLSSGEVVCEDITFDLDSPKKSMNAETISLAIVVLGNFGGLPIDLQTWILCHLCTSYAIDPLVLWTAMYDAPTKRDVPIPPERTAITSFFIDLCHRCCLGVASPGGAGAGNLVVVHIPRAQIPCSPQNLAVMRRLLLKRLGINELIPTAISYASSQSNAQHWHGFPQLLPLYCALVTHHSQGKHFPSPITLALYAFLLLDLITLEASLSVFPRQIDLDLGSVQNMDRLRLAWRHYRLELEAFETRTDRAELYRTGFADSESKDFTQASTAGFITQVPSLLAQLQQERSQLLSVARRLDKRVYDDLQLLVSLRSFEDAQKSIEQSEIAIEESRRMKGLSILAFIFIPLSLVTSIFGMNIQEMTGSGQKLWVFFVTTAVICLFSVVLFFISMWMETKGGFRAVLVPKLATQRHQRQSLGLKRSL